MAQAYLCYSECHEVAQIILLRLRGSNDSSYVDSHQNDCYCQGGLSPHCRVLSLIYLASLSGPDPHLSVWRAGESARELREGTCHWWACGELLRARQELKEFC